MKKLTSYCWGLINDVVTLSSWKGPFSSSKSLCTNNWSGTLGHYFNIYITSFMSFFNTQVGSTGLNRSPIDWKRGWRLSAGVAPVVGLFTKMYLSSYQIHYCHTNMDAEFMNNNCHTLLKFRSPGKNLVLNPATEKNKDKGLSFVLKYYKKDFWPSFSKGSYPHNNVLL